MLLKLLEYKKIFHNILTKGEPFIRKQRKVNDKIDVNWIIKSISIIEKSCINLADEIAGVIQKRTSTCIVKVHGAIILNISL